MIHRAIRSPLRPALASPFVRAILAGGGGAALPTTATLSAAQANLGYTGSTSLTQSAGKLSVVASLGYWVGNITGTEALLTAYQNASSTPAGMIEVSIDGGAFSACAQLATKYVLFTGLPQATRRVVFRVNAAYGVSSNVSASGTVLTVTGAPPSVETPTWWAHPADGSANVFSAAATVANIANFSPKKLRTSSGGLPGNVPMVAIKGDFLKLFVAGIYTHCFVSVDGAAPTRFTGPLAGTPTASLIQSNIIPGTPGVHTYYVWGTHNTTPSGGHFSVGAVEATSPVAVTRRLVQWGDSITYGTGGSSTGEADTLKVAAALGFVGNTQGIAGQKIAQVVARISTDASFMALSTADVAVLAIGRNDVAAYTTSMTAQNITDYTSGITTLLAAGFGTVLCRGVLPETGGSYSNFNAGIAAIVSGYGDPRVKYVDPAGWQADMSWADGVHPNDAGYTALAAHCVTAYTPLV